MRPGTAGRLATALLVALTGVAVVSGCERQISGPSLVLRLATPDKKTDATGPQVEHFADEVAQRSGGTIRVDPVWDVTPDGAVNWDQTVARGVADGTWDMGLVPGRAWDELGVDSLRALNTPFLVTTEAALRTVLDSDLRDELLAGLPAAGVTGLDLFPDQLRHPFGYSEPLLGAGDYAGQTIWAATSDTATHVFAALGATTTDAAADAGTQRGAEGQYLLTQARIATGNVTFYPKTDTLVLRTSVRDHLRDDQWALLRGAAAATRRWLYAAQPSDLELAGTFCQQGGSIVAASRAQVADLEQAVEPAVRWLRRDPDTRRLIDAIGDVIDGVPGEAPPTSCPEEPPPSPDDAQLRSLDGTYVWRVTGQQLREAGESNAVKVRENSGDYTLVLDGGSYTSHQVAHHYLQHPDGTGRYTYEDGVLTWYWTESDWTRASLNVASDGTITFRDIVDADPANQALSEGVFSSPWTRVGGVPD